MVAIVAAVLFAVFFGYFIAFETFWNGRTPGKKIMGLRVVRDGGYALDFTASAIRNLIRVGELLVGFYAVSAIASVLSPENKRLGDMAAGTIVVRDSRVLGLSTFTEAANTRLASITDEEYALLGQFAVRRHLLAPAAREAMAAQLAARVRARAAPEMQTLDDETLLLRLSGD